MTLFIAQNLAPIMFATLVAFMLLGYPVAFALAANGLLFFFIAVELSPYAPETITLSWPLLQALPERVFGTMSNEVLLAIPFFTFMGLVLERSGMAEDLLETIGQLFGMVRGGLAYAVIFVGALLAATTGVVAASVISMGLISLPIMLRYGYDRRLASGVIAASGTLAQIIPPSLVLIVMADQLGRSVGDMYDGAFLPGLILAGLYALFVFLVTLVSPKSAPGLPPEALTCREPSGARGVWQLGVLVAFSTVVAILVMRDTQVKPGADFVILSICIATVVALVSALFNRFLGAHRLGLSAVLTAAVAVAYVAAGRSGHPTLALFADLVGAGVLYAFLAGAVERATGVCLVSRMAERVTFVMVPPLLLIFLVLGTIFLGVATPTEGGAMGAVGAMVLAALKRRLERNPARFSLSIITQATQTTAKLSAFAIFIVLGARVFSLTFYGINGHLWVEHLLTSLPGGQVGFLLFINALIFFLAFFLDFFELAFIIIPLIGPAAEKLGIDLIWLGVMLGVNMQTSFMHPPFGFALFYLRSVAPKVPYLDKITGKRMEPITSAQIYWGAIPFVVIQLVMVGLIIFFPQLVVRDRGMGAVSDPAAAQRQLDGLDGPGALPGLPAMPGLDDLPKPGAGL
ncbi:TRAP transporter large permease subunit [Xanthobacter dioxanivorans]|uniref:TRAP transporter large permease subunit n=1 Tax=Xanthobacter dioxanivorans TaxID=2528964 RepID=A0A974PLT5_9HYPH|nr:TRAP transporter large permease subunit [Xanthobacter dioxanivorans]QRG05952.1 TRAP transporter large permease subunit [Xanthobacter dioxanivorans]